MLRTLTALGLAAALMTPGPVAQAGVYTDDLGKCLVRSAGDADQHALVVWVFAAISRHPGVAAYGDINAEQHEAITRKAAELTRRLLVEDCRKEAVAALKYEGGEALEGAFELLGQVAFRGLLNNADVAQSLQDLGKFVDQKEFDALATEAGLVRPSQ